MNLFGIVVAAGVGSRFGRPKAQVPLRGRPLWEWARSALREGGVEEVVVVGAVPGGVPGGDRRRDSVMAGLSHAPPAATHVLVHDAARPLASAALVQAVVARLETGDVDAVVPVLAINDTVKRIIGDRVVATIDRTGLALVQTPQGFVIGALRSAHAAGDDDASDDAVMVERQGGVVATVPGEPVNLKLTYPDDLAHLEALAP